MPSPLGSGSAYLDPIGGLHGAAATVVALLARELTGRGQAVEVAQREAAMHWIGELILDAAVNGQRIETHPIVIRRVKTLARDTVCHILYANAADLQHVETARNGVLTVSDARGGIINFIIKDNRVRFDIDDEAAAQSGLNISSKLLGIALNVKPRKGK